MLKACKSIKPSNYKQIIHTCTLRSNTKRIKLYRYLPNFTINISSFLMSILECEYFHSFSNIIEVSFVY